MFMTYCTFMSNLLILVCEVHNGIGEKWEKSNSNVKLECVVILQLTMQATFTLLVKQRLSDQGMHANILKTYNLHSKE